MKKKMMIEDLVEAIKYDLFGKTNSAWMQEITKDIKYIIEEKINDWEMDGEITINE